MKPFNRKLQRGVLTLIAMAGILSPLNYSGSDPLGLAATGGNRQPESGPPGMVWIPSGEFTMGTDEREAYPAERPAHRVRVSGFWMDATEVTNQQFRKFVGATGYKTTAERPVDWEQLRKQLPPGTPKPGPEKLAAGSLVFTNPRQPVSLADPAAWWKWTPDADWRHPEGPASNLDGRWNHPVVHVSWEDAAAYAIWAGKRLPTEAEWEIAARGGLESQRYGWGEHFQRNDRWMANTFQGQFPVRDTGSDRFIGTAPVRSFPANGYGLYDMIGNVWEWCSDWYRADAYQHIKAHQVTSNSSGPQESWDPEAPYAARRVTKGGSYLCSGNYCVNYRPSSRRGTDWDTGMSHVGFRCVWSAGKKTPSPSKSF